MLDRFHPDRLSRHAIREARREQIPMAMIAGTYDDPNDVRPSDHDDLRETRSRWFGDDGVEVAVDTDDRPVVTVWRKGAR